MKSRLDFGLLTAFFIPLLALLPLLTHAGLPNTADGPAHLMRQVELDRAWAEGNFYPRWGTDLALGHGMPIFSYAPPSLYQLTQLFHLAGLPLDEAMKGVLIFDFLLYSLGMFLLARRIYGPYPALLAAALYVYAPYRLREAYIQGNYGQFTGLAFYPLIFWAFHGLMSEGRLRYLPAAALSLAGLLFSHNISFMLFAPLLAAYLLLLLLLPGRLSIPAFLRAGAAGLLGLGLAAIFWLPAFGERHDIKLEGITQGFFDFRENFISLSELLSPPLPLDLTAINPEFPLSLGLPQIIAGAAGIISLFFLGRRLLARFERPGVKALAREPVWSQTLFFALFGLIYAFLALPASQPLWETFPLLELAEFPWRMLGPAIFCASLLGAAALALLNDRLAGLAEGRRWLLVAGPLLLVVALNAHYLYPSQFIVWGTPTPAQAFQYEVSSGAIGTTSTGEFLPRWAQQHPRPETLWPDYAAGRPPQKVDPATLPPGARVETLSHRSESDSLRLSSPEPFTATLRTLYWPGWQLYLDGQPLPFTVTPQTGLIQAAIPTGQHTLTLQLESTPLRTVGLWLSGLSLLLLVGTVIYSVVAAKVAKPGVHSVSQPELRQEQKNPSAHRPLAPHASRFTFHVSRFTFHVSRLTPHVSPQFFLLTALSLLALYLFSRPLADRFVLRSEPDRPQVAGRGVQADFGDQIRLVGLDQFPAVVTLPAEGETELELVLYWRALRPLETNYSVFVHLDAPNGQTFATADEVNPEDIPTRNWPPGLYLRNPLHLKLPAHLPPIRYELHAGLYHRESGERLALDPEGATSFGLGPIWLARPRPEQPPETPLATFGPHLALYGAELTGNTLTLLWKTDQPLAQEYSIFVHVLDAKGNLLNQADGVPHGGLYPLPHWLPGQLIEDVRSFELAAEASRVAIGVYDPGSGARLPALDPEGQPLWDDSFIILVSHEQ